MRCSGFQGDQEPLSSGADYLVDFARHVRSAPESIALVLNSDQLSYRDLDRLSNVVAQQLKAKGVGHEARVLLAVPPSFEQIIALIGILKAGAAYVPLDRSLPAARLEFIEAESCADDRIDGLPPLAQLRECRPTDDFSQATTAPDSLAYILFTSGSTGAPKGVLMEQGSLRHLIQWQLANSRAHLRTLQFASLGFDVSFQEIFSTLASGGSLVLMSPEVKKDLVSTARLICDERVERVFLPFAILHQLAEIFAELAITPVHLKEIITAGEQLQLTAAIRRLREKIGGLRLVNQYGPTESHVVTAHEVLGDSPLPPIGRAIPSAQIFILDPATLQPLADGEKGEIFIGGPCLARGYLNRPDLTAERFIHWMDSSTGISHRLYRSGDIGRLSEDGELEYKGRNDHQVKIRGFRVELVEVETCIRALPEIVDVAAVVLSMPATGSRLVACAVTAGNLPLDQLILRAQLSRRLPDYMIPSQWIRLPQLPVNANGKIDRFSLTDIARASVLQEPALERSTHSVEDWFRELLSIPPTAALAEDAHFFQLGGNSLLAARLIARAINRLQLPLTIRDLFENPTLRGFENRVETLKREMHGFVAPSTAPRVRQDRTKDFALSPAQAQIWSLCQKAEDTSAFHIVEAFEIQGTLERKRLQRSIEQLVERHEALRVQIHISSEGVRQTVTSSLPVALEWEDASLHPELGALIEHRAFDPMPIVDAPLCRFRVFEVAQNRSILLVAVHHIIADGWSLGVLLNDLAALYREEPLPELPLQFVDFIERNSKASSESIAFWRNYLEGSDAYELPPDRVRPAGTGSNPAGIWREPIPEDLTRSLEQLAQSCDVTLFSILVTAYEALLRRYSGAEDFLFGTMVAVREAAEADRVVGLFLNSVLLRSRLSQDSSAVESLKRKQADLLGVLQHSSLPFPEVLAEMPALNVDAFRYLFVLQNAPMACPEFANCDVSRRSVSPRAAKADLALSVEPSENSWTACFEFRTDIFDRQSIERLARHYRQILRSLAKDPHHTVDQLDIYGSDDKLNACLHAFTDVNAGYTARNVVQLFEDMAKFQPHRIALEYRDQTYSYAELNTIANRAARSLKASGLRSEHRVAILMGRRPEFLMAILAVLKAGGAYVPLDPDYPRERLDYMLADSKPDRILEEHSWQALVEAAPDDSGNLAEHIGWDQLAYVIYTSGSTGRPKGTLLTHRGLANMAVSVSQAFCMDTQERVLQFSSFCFDASVCEIFTTWAMGATLLIESKDQLLPGPGLTEFINQRRVSFAILTPAVLSLLSPQALPGLAKVVTAGEACPKELAWHWAPGRTFINGYGPTEASVCSTALVMDPNEALLWTGRSLPIGKAVNGVEVQILDGALAPAPLGGVGEICTGGLGLARGYWNRPELDAGKFIQWQDRRLYLTGDLGRYRADGTIEFLGRRDSQMKLRGFRIELGEIEDALLRVPGIREAVVVPVGEQAAAKVLVAFFVAEHELDPIPGFLRSRLRDSLPEPMLPSRFARLAAIPLAPSGKADRRLLAQWASGDWGRDEKSPRQTASLQTATERDLACIWSEVLKTAHIERSDRFFDLGGHSLLAAQVLARIRARWHLDLRSLQWFLSSTLEEFARTIDEYTRGIPGPQAIEAPLAPAIDWEQESSLGFAVHRRNPRADDGLPHFLTGATGYLGAFLLRELLVQTSQDVICLVRAANADEGRSRVRSQLQTLGLWRDVEPHWRRIKVEPGDLSQSKFGWDDARFIELARAIGRIYHCGASTNFVSPYRQMRSENVHGTREIIRLATLEVLKPLHHISTLSVFSSAWDRDINEGDHPPFHGLSGGYPQSKWIAEQLVRQAKAQGLPAWIYRPGNIGGSTLDGTCSLSDFTGRMMRGSIQAGCFPNIAFDTDYTPVDYVSRSIVSLSRYSQEISGADVFHHCNPTPLSARTILQALRTSGRPVEPVPNRAWLEAVSAQGERNALYPLIPFLIEHFVDAEPLRAPRYRSHATQIALQRIGAIPECPAADVDLLRKVVAYLQEPRVAS